MIDYGDSRRVFPYLLQMIHWQSITYLLSRRKVEMLRSTVLGLIMMSRKPRPTKIDKNQTLARPFMNKSR